MAPVDMHRGWRESNKIEFTNLDSCCEAVVSVQCANPNGHFYSPVVDPADITRREASIWPPRPHVLGVEFSVPEHRAVIERDLAPVAQDFPFPHSQPEGGARYFERNDQFGRTDARVLFSLLRSWKPRRIIEVGSGFSTLLMAETIRDFLDGQAELVCIEPYPREFLRRGVAGVSRLIEAQVQDVALSEFESLEAGDILFIDSSHVAKTGSDVLYLYFEVLPRLRKGVRIHIHDIFLPADYPRRWVVDENRSWNEQYVLRGLLMYSTRFAVIFGTAFALNQLSGELGGALGLPPSDLYSAGSLWIEVLG